MADHNFYKFITVKKTWFIIIVLLNLNTSCKKSGFGSVEGTVYEAGTNAPAPNVYVYLSWNDGDKSWQEREMTDASGHYKISFYKRSARKYNLSAVSDAYWSPSDNYDVDKRKTKHDLFITPTAKIQFRVINNRNVSTYIAINTDKTIQSFTAKANSDTLLPQYHIANGYGKTNIFGFIGKHPNEQSFSDAEFIYTKDALVTHTLYIN